MWMKDKGCNDTRYCSSTDDSTIKSASKSTEGPIGESPGHPAPRRNRKGPLWLLITCAAVSVAGLVLSVVVAGAFLWSDKKPDVANQPPTVAFLSPLEGQVFYSTDHIRLEADANAQDGKVRSVQFYLNDAPAGPEVTRKPFQLVLPSLPIGNFTLKAVSKDAGALQSTPAVVKILVVSEQETGTLPDPQPRATAAKPSTERSEGLPPAPLPPATSDEVVLRLHGSNTIGAKLVPALAEAFLKQEGFAEIRRLPGRDHEEMSIRGQTSGSTAAKVIEIHSHGSSTAFKDLMDGKCDIGMSSRKIKDDEAQRMKEWGFGDVTSPNGEHVLALDGIAVVVHRANPVKTLSVEQIGAIFSGAVTNWAELKGAPGRIQVYARDDKSGTYDTFKSLVLKDRHLVDSAQRFEDSALLSDRVAADPNGIGFIGLPYVRSARAVEIQAAGAQPVLPTPFTVAREDYPLSRRLFLYTPEIPRNPLIQKFIEFALSKDGQQIGRESGFVDQLIQAEIGARQVAGNPKDLPSDKYVMLTQNARQLSVSFRFRKGTDQLDNKSIRDLDRMILTLSGQDQGGKELMLFGFADNKGNDLFNQSLSRSRAMLVAEELRKRGAAVKTVEGFGSRNPIASNDTEDGREKNRRVEVWIMD